MTSYYQLLDNPKPRLQGTCLEALVVQRLFKTKGHSGCWRERGKMHIQETK